MATITRYYSTSGVGIADGSTWENRAPLFSGGAWNSGIINFGYSSDTQLAVIDPGTYNITASLVTFSGVAPTSTGNFIFLHAGDGSGGLWSPPDVAWKSCERMWSTGNMPVLIGHSNLSLINHAGVGLRGLIIESTGNGVSTTINGLRLAEWCVVRNGSSSTSACAMGGTNQWISNSWFECYGSAYESVAKTVSNRGMFNCRIQGNNASSGLREGYRSTSNGTYLLEACTVVNNIGAGINAAGTSTGVNLHVTHCVVASTGTINGDILSNSGTASSPGVVAHSILYGGHYGLDNIGGASIQLFNNIFRDNSSGYLNNVNWPSGIGVIASTGTNSSEFVDHLNGDWTIKYGSSIWGKGYGVADELAPTGSPITILSQFHPLGGF